MIPAVFSLSDLARAVLEAKGEFPLIDRTTLAADLHLTSEELAEVEIEIYSLGILGVMATADGPVLIWGQPR